MTVESIHASLTKARAFLFDLDGTLVLGNKQNKELECLPGAVELLELLAARDIPYGVLTNGTVRPPAEYCVKLAELGLSVPERRMMTPATVAADYFTGRRIRTVLALGVEGVWKPLSDAGLEVIVPPEGGDPGTADAVFVGWYREIHMDAIEAACQAVWNGAGLYAASMVPFFATKTGRALGSSRAVSAMITSVTGKRATALGKPSLHALKSAAARLGCQPDELVVVGDQPELEVRMALMGGAVAVHIRTGDTDAAQETAYPPGDQPQLSIAGVAGLLELLE